MSRTAVILLAAGRGARMDGAVPDKVLAPLAGRPVFVHSVAAFMASSIADFYVVVYRDARQMTELMAYAPTPSALVRGAWSSGASKKRRKNGSSSSGLR